jgi:hypothetical protein
LDIKAGSQDYGYVAFYAGVVMKDDNEDVKEYPWSVTLTGQEGLPGTTANRDGVNVTCYKTGIIRPEKPIRSLRFTVAGTRNGEKPNGNLIFALSELNVFKADGKTEVGYTSSSNADHVTITKSFYGQGLAALNDGKFNNYFH